jgi:two-component system response regulator YesN
MYRLLVVDDERFAVKGITQGIDWTDSGFGEVLEAYSVEEAKHLFRTNPVDVMIADIEMPGDNGIQLLDWVRSFDSSVQTIFLTGHANFGYAQQSVHLGCYEYILKPVDHTYLKETVIRALQEVIAERDVQSFMHTYGNYVRLWENQRPLLIERFWQDVIAESIPVTNRQLASSLALYEIPLEPDDDVVPILISIERWKETLSARDEEIMEYAIRNAAMEAVLRSDAGMVIQARNGGNLVLLYGNKLPDDALSELVERCNEFIQSCIGYFQCSLSCYLGEPTPIHRLHTAYERLMSLERRNILETSTVIVQRKAECDELDTTMVALPSFADLSVLFESGKREELVRRIRDTFRTLTSGSTDIETMNGFRFGLLHMIYNVFHQKGLSVDDAFNESTLLGVTTIRSLRQLEEWTERTVREGLDYLEHAGKSGSGIIDRVRQYVLEHLQDDLTREDIAASVYLNPAYLSRLFKKETGISLTDYIVQERISRAKTLLENSSMKISSVAEMVGYTHFSHFAKTFKKSVGLSPQEYQKWIEKRTSQ